MTAAIALGLSALKSQTPTPRPLGSFTLGQLGAPVSGCPTGFTCYNFTTICPNIVQTRNGDGHIAIMQPPSAATQLDIFFPGAGGKFWEGINPPLVDPFYQQLIEAGHIVVDVQWSNSIWYSAAAAELAGPEALACRPATVIRWVHDNWLPAGVRYVVVGSSAGSSAISYSLTTYGLDSLVQLLVPISGPPHARLTYNCLNPSPEDALGSNGEQVIDNSWGYVNGNYGPCYLHDPNFTPEWDANSVESGGINYFWPTTQVQFVVGGEDTQGIRDNATALFNVLTGNGTAASYQLVPNMGHSMQKSQDGLNALFTVLTETPMATPTPTPTPTATPTPTPSSTPIAMKAAPKGAYLTSRGKLSSSNQAASAAGPSISQANCDGVRWTVRWADIETTAGSYTWQYLDDAVALAATNGKNCGISVNAGIDCPAWLWAPPYNAQSYTMQDTSGAVGLKIPVPGDPVFMSRWQKFITDFGARYDSNPAVSYIIITGIGNHDEWDIAPGTQDTAALGSTQAEVNAWKSSSKQIIDSYMSAFPGTTVMGLPVPPFNPSNAAEDPATSMREVSDYAANTYNCHFAYSIAPLQSSTTTSNSVAANEIFLHWMTNPTHGETLNPASSPDDFNATLHVALDLKIRGMEIYKVDFENPALQSYTVGSGPYAGETGGITPRRADFLAIPAPTPCPTPTATPTPTPSPSADLKVTVSDGKTAAIAGAQDTYTIVVTNVGPAAANGASVSDSFPAALTGLTFTASQTGGATGFTASGSGNISDVVTMPPASTITYKARGKLSSAATGTLSNTAQVTAPAGISDPNAANNTATDTDTITFKADLKVTLTDGKTAAIAGTQDTYTIVVTNAGPSNVTGAAIQDTFPAAFTGVTYTAIQSGGASGFSASGSGNIDDTVNMPAGSRVTYKATGTISASATGSISDTATVTSPNGVPDPNTANNSATDADTL